MAVIRLRLTSNYEWCNLQLRYFGDWESTSRMSCVLNAYPHKFRKTVKSVGAFSK